MDKPTVQDIFLRFYPRYLDTYHPSPQQSQVAHCIINCKTGAYGANVSICEDCGHPQVHYNSCRNRCCPMCQALPKELWMDKRREDVLDAPYFHVVFTVPQPFQFRITIHIPVRPRHDIDLLRVLTSHCISHVHSLSPLSCCLSPACTCHNIHRTDTHVCNP